MRRSDDSPDTKPASGQEERFIALDPAQELKPNEYHQLAARIARLDVPRHGVHVLSSFSAQFLEPLLLVEGHRVGLALELTFAPYGQFEQELHNPESGVWRVGTRAIVVLLRPEDVEPDLYRSPRAYDLDDRLRRLEDRIVGLVTQLRERSRASIFVANTAPVVSSEPGTPSPINQALEQFNERVGRRLGQLSDCHIFDWAGTVADFGVLRWHDLRLWYLARVPCSQEAGAFVSQRLGRRLASVLSPRTKCVVLDLDDTLWGGVIGDDGVEGIRLGGDYPGSVFKDFQLRLKELTRKGILLAIASKNDEVNVREAFARHPDMVLGWNDFASHRINWGPKDEGIRQMAEELNIGTDSMVFLDDNPVECAAVSRGVPGVQAICLGRDPLRFDAILSNIATLDRPIVTQEDEDRTSMYLQARQRREHEQNGQAQTKEEFLVSLGMKAEVALCDMVTLPRVVQLIGKTNQFNLTTRRYAHDEVRALLGSADARVLTLRLSDVYGDLGLVSVGILQRSKAIDSCWDIDVFLMSCRVMGRGVEDAFLAFMQESARAAGGKEMRGHYIPSAKNGIVRDFYPEHGFAGPFDTASTPDNRLFALNLSQGGTSWPEHIQRAQKLP